MPKDNSDHPLIMVAPNGARRGKADHPEIPITIEEIRDETVACAAAGANALHLHVRDHAGRHTLDAGRYREALEEIETALPGFPVQITTESADLFSVEQQVQCLRDLRPAAASISVREMAREPDIAARAYDLCASIGTQVQHILYDQADWQRLDHWIRRGIVKPDQTSVICVLGQYAPPRAATLQDLTKLKSRLSTHPGRVMICAFGPNEHAVLRAAAALGADLRVGFENNIHDQTGRLAQSNASNVAALRAALTTTFHREPAP